MAVKGLRTQSGDFSLLPATNRTLRSGYLTRDSVLGGVLFIMQNHSGGLDVVTHLRTTQEHFRCSAPVCFWWDIQESVHKTLKITKHSAHHLSKGGNCTSRLLCWLYWRTAGAKKAGVEKSQNILRNTFRIITTACPCERYFCVYHGHLFCCSFCLFPT